MSRMQPQKQLERTQGRKVAPDQAVGRPWSHTLGPAATEAEKQRGNKWEEGIKRKDKEQKKRQSRDKTREQQSTDTFINSGRYGNRKCPWVKRERGGGNSIMDS